MNFIGNIEKDVKELKKILSSDDIDFIETKVSNKLGYIVFIKNIVDKKAIGELILSPISEIKEIQDKDQILEIFLSPDKKTVGKVEDCCQEVVQGNCIFIVDGIKEAFSFGLQKFEKRSITEPPTSTVIKGPREGFVENISVNLSLLRRRIKSTELQIENFSIGNLSNTQVSICYLKKTADTDLVKKIRKELKGIDIECTLDSSFISKKLSQHKTGIFKQLGNTEKPDILASKLLEGRIAIFVDGSPIVLTVPYLLIEDFQSPSDYYNSAYSGTFARFIRIFSIVLSLLLPSLFVSSELFHLQLIPISFLLTIVNSIKGIPLSPSYEMFCTLLIFEILNEASVRMPKYVGMVVSIVGGLVLGETAVNAGIISAPTLMIIAFSGICLYTVPELVQSFSVIRILFLIVAGSFGLYALLCTLAIFITYLISFESFSTPICAPYSPLVKPDLKDGVVKSFLLDQKHRPVSLLQKKRKEKNVSTEN